MDWLSKYQGHIDYLKQRIAFRGPKGKEIIHRGKPKGSGVRLISAIRARKLMGQGCKGYLCNVVQTETPKTSLENIPVIQEFPNVLPKEISGVPPPREVEFCIDFILGLY